MYSKLKQRNLMFINIITCVLRQVGCLLKILKNFILFRKTIKLLVINHVLVKISHFYGSTSDFPMILTPRCSIKRQNNRQRTIDHKLNVLLSFIAQLNASIS